MTPLHAACENGSVEHLQMLLAARADPDIRTARGTTPLLLSIQTRRADCTRMLLEAACDVDLQALHHRHITVTMPSRCHHIDVTLPRCASGNVANWACGEIPSRRLPSRTSTVTF